MHPDGIDNRILGGRLMLRQPRTGFRSGSDAVLLAAAAHPVMGGRVLELGCASGAAMLSLAWRRSDIRVTGVEIDPECVVLAAFNAARNGLKGRVDTYVGDITSMRQPSDRFDMVILNPPYFTTDRHRRSPDAARDRARAEGSGRLGDWMHAARQATGDNGEIVMIVRTERVHEVLSMFGEDYAVRQMPVIGSIRKPAKRTLLSVRPGRGRETCRPALLHRYDNSDSGLAEALFRHGAPLYWR